MSATQDTIALALPANPQYVRLARLTAASLASRLGFSYDEVEDLRIAVDELCSHLIGPDGRPGEIRLTFAVDDGARLVIEGTGARGSGPVEPPELVRQILSAIVDEYQVTEANGGLTFRMVCRRHHG